MIHSWILSKLSPLLGQPVIILHDPQRMIVSGAHVVDGWAEEHNYTVLFCTGNLVMGHNKHYVSSSRRPVRLG